MLFGSCYVLGQGAAWFRDEADLAGDLGDLVRFVGVKGAVVQGVTLADPPNTAAHFEYCRGVAVRGVRARGNVTNKAVQGVLFDSTSGAALVDSAFNVGGVAFRVQAGAGREGAAVAIPCEDVVFQNCSAIGGEGARSVQGG